MTPEQPAQALPSAATGREFVLLRDGGQAELRTLSRGDRAAVERFFETLSGESLHLRFHSPVKLTAALVDRLLSGHNLGAMVQGELIALASYYRLHDPSQAEVALAVADGFQGRGVGTALFERLAADARTEGIERFLALVMQENRLMIELLRGLGFGMKRQMDHGELEFDVDLRQEGRAIASADARRHVAASASLAPLFHPRAVAVIGASRDRGSIGHEIFRNLLQGGFNGPVYPVNPAAQFIASVRAYPSVAAIPDAVDMAVVAVPVGSVLEAAEEALKAGVRALVVVTAGFAEVGEDGRRRQDQLLALCRSHSARLVGPNCLGVLANAPEVSMNATFAPNKPEPGGLAIASQSGALGIAILDHARELGLGVSDFVSMGNKADLSSNDLLERWEDEPQTTVILLYLESFGNPERFARVARRVGSKKPIIAIKGGRGEVGRRAAESHTAALAGSNIGVEALFRQAGVIQCETLEESFDVALLLANQPVPAGRRVGIITNAGGLGILCADACEAEGLELPVLSDSTLAALRACLPSFASQANPLDVTASCAPEDYGQAVRLLQADPRIDAVIALFIPLATASQADLSIALAAACNPAPGKPILACFAGSRGQLQTACGTLVPLFSFPEGAARALSRATERGTWLRRPLGELPPPDHARQQRARTLIRRAAKSAGSEASFWLDAPDAIALLRLYGIPAAEGVLAYSPREAADAAERLGVPVAVKLRSRRLAHKSDVGAVRLNVQGGDEAEGAYRAIVESLTRRGPAADLEGVLVQPMVTGGVECLIGLVRDPMFGPLIAFGLGGMTVEVLKDVAFRLNPLSDLDADQLIRSIKGFPLLDGYRGQPRADLLSLRNVLLAVSQLVEDLPEIRELDLNPVLAREDGVTAVDARVRVDSAASQDRRPAAGSG